MRAPNALRVIIVTELLALRNRLVKRNLAALVAVGVVLFVAGGPIGGAVFSLGIAAGAFLRASVDSFLAAAFTGLSLMMLLLGFPSVIAALFVGRDLLQLVVAPVRLRDIFAARLAIAMSANLLLGTLLLAFVLGLGVGAGAGILFFPVAVLLVVLQVLAVTALQAALMTAIVRWVPARLARDVAAGVAGLSGAGLYVAWNLSLRQTFTRKARPDFSGLNGLAHRIDWLPTAWPGHALSAIVDGSPATTLAWVIATLVLAALLVAAAELLYERTLLSGLGLFGAATPAWRRRSQRPAAQGMSRGAGSPTTAIARKDWLGYRRDVRRLTRILPALLVPVGYAVAFSQPGRTPTGFWSNIALVTFLSMFVSVAIATPSIPTERRGFQLLRMAPITMWQVLRAKVFIALPLVLATMIAFSIAVAMISKSGVVELLGLIIFGVWLATGFVSIAVAGGAVDPHFEATDDRRSVGIVGSVTALGGSFGFALLSLGALALFFFGAQAAAGTANLGPIPSTPAVGAAMVAGAAIFLLGAGVLVGLVLLLAHARLSAFEASISAT